MLAPVEKHCEWCGKRFLIERTKGRQGNFSARRYCTVECLTKAHYNEKVYGFLNACRLRVLCCLFCRKPYVSRLGTIVHPECLGVYHQLQNVAKYKYEPTAKGQVKLLCQNCGGGFDYGTGRPGGVKRKYCSASCMKFAQAHALGQRTGGQVTYLALVARDGPHCHLCGAEVLWSDIGPLKASLYHPNQVIGGVGRHVMENSFLVHWSCMWMAAGLRRWERSRGPND